MDPESKRVVRFVVGLRFLFLYGISNSMNEPLSYWFKANKIQIH